MHPGSSPAEKIGAGIKLLGRCVINGDDVKVMVAPFMIPKSEALATVSGVYNAVEVIGEPIGNVMFYGQGAGAGATASAVVGDLMQIMRSGINAAAPVMVKTEEGVLAFDGFVCRSYVAVVGGCRNCVKDAFGEVDFIDCDGEIAFVTKEISESDALSALEKLTAKQKTLLLM